MQQSKKGLHSNTLKGGRQELSSTAQTAKVLQAQREWEQKERDAVNVLEKMKSTNMRLWAICRIMYVSGCRVTEALGLRCENISSTGWAKVQGVKRSSSFYINDSELASYLIKFRGCTGRVFNGLNRFSVYRWVKGYGLQHKKMGNSNSSVTHYFRHVYAAKLRFLELENELIQKGLRHKSILTQEHYGK